MIRGAGYIGSYAYEGFLSCHHSG